MEDVVYLKVSWGIGAGLSPAAACTTAPPGWRGSSGTCAWTPTARSARAATAAASGTVAGIGPLLELLRGSTASLAGLLALLSDGHPAAVRAVDDGLASAVGRALAALCNAFNPSAIVVGGELAGPALIDGIRDALMRHALPAAGDAVTVTTGALGDRAAVLGALALVIGDAERLRSTGLVAV